VATKTNPKTVRQIQGQTERIIGVFAAGVIREMTEWDFGPYTTEMLVLLCGFFLSGIFPDLADRLKN
jgi:hypothetical protein